MEKFFNSYIITKAELLALDEGIKRLEEENLELKRKRYSISDFPYCSNRELRCVARAILQELKNRKAEFFFHEKNILEKKKKMFYNVEDLEEKIPKEKRPAGYESHYYPWTL